MKSSTERRTAYAVAWLVTMSFMCWAAIAALSMLGISVLLVGASALLVGTTTSLTQEPPVHGSLLIGLLLLSGVGLAFLIAITVIAGRGAVSILRGGSEGVVMLRKASRLLLLLADAIWLAGSVGLVAALRAHDPSASLSATAFVLVALVLAVLPVATLTWLRPDAVSRPMSPFP
jgi:hypothetical protein